MQQSASLGSACHRASSDVRLHDRRSFNGHISSKQGRQFLNRCFATASFKVLIPGMGQRSAADVAHQKSRGDRSGRPSAGGARRVAVVWFRNDLRVHDNEALATANRESTSLLPVYCFDPREFGTPVNGISSTGPYRAQFVLDAVDDLRESLRAAGSDLIVRIGKPEEVLVDLAKKVGASKVYCHSGVTYEEDHTEKQVAAALKTEDIQLKACWGSTLYSPDELPFEMDKVPPTHGEFRTAVASLPIRQPEKAPAQLKGKPLGCGSISSGDIPTLAQLGVQPLSHIPGAPRCRGGETEGLAQLDRLLSSSAQGSSMSNAFCASFSQQVSPWLAMGCLSPRRMYAEVQARASSTNKALVAMAHGELLWRDFFRFTAKKYCADSIKKDSAQQGPSIKASASPMLTMAYP
ncbi:Cryptochrome DASH [Coccomyxa sp. Obi]|nr:Cryptochrome DASH [Coccomyxa sp. Obi]